MIRVIIERRCLTGREEEMPKLLLELRMETMRQPGYISGETLKSVDDPTLWLVISNWTDIDCWKSWENSPKRREMTSKIAPLLAVPEKISIFKASLFNYALTYP